MDDPSPDATDPAPPPGQAGPTVLLVDDSPHERLAMRRLLAAHGYATSEATDGAEAIAHVKAGRFDAVLLDLEMPGTDGFGVLDYLQEHRRAMPVVLLSGMPLDRIQERMRRMVSPTLPPLLVKPVDPDQVLTVLEMLLDGSLGDDANGSPASG